jgi:cell division protein FtsN
MKQTRPTLAKDYSALFLGAILLGLFVIVLGLMTAITQSRARTMPLLGQARLLTPPAQRANLAITPTIHGRIGEPAEPFGAR